MNVFAKCDEILLMILQDIKKTKGSIQKPLRITKGNNSNSIGPWPLIFISSIGHILMNVFAKFDEIPSMTLQDIKKQNVTDTPLRITKGNNSNSSGP